MKAYTVVTSFAVAGLVGLAACATPGDNGPTAITAPSSASLLAVGDVTDNTAELGVLKVCKTGNIGGDFTLSREQHGVAPLLGYIFGILAPTFHLDPDAVHCRVAAVDNGGDGIWSILTLGESSPDLQSVTKKSIDVFPPGTTDTRETIEVLGKVASIEHSVNSFHGAVVTFNNFREPPPEQVCDFITFGRLVTTVGGDKVVISGNAGGNKPGGGILGEFHVEVGGVDYHVSDITSYGPITNAPLQNLTNSRVVIGTSKNGHLVELRLWDGGEPGKDTDVVWVKIDGTVRVPTQFIDQGNMQYHANCRGPGD
jgi:hypothetical protein